MSKNNILFYTIGLVLLFSCKDNSPENAVANANDQESRQALINKYNVYVDALNSESKDVSRVYKEYMESINPETGELYPKTGFSGSMSSSKPYSLEQIEKIVDQDPDLAETDELAKQYIKEFEEVRVLIGDLSSYFKTREYTQDNFKMSKEMAPKLMDEFNSFFKVDSAFNSKIVAMDKAFRKQEMERFKENGEEILYAHAILLQSLEDHIQYISNYTYNNFDELDQKVYEDLTNAVSKKYKEYKEKIKDEEAFKKQIPNYFRAPSFSLEVENYIQLARRVNDTAKDQDKFDRMIKSVEFTNNTFGTPSPEELNKIYSNIIRSSNLMR
ncbi:hypothetical protein GCM10009117_02770 [Gangjinia marincola]|uniref:DUF3829 domain-containing protein n=1 Tax=Gangjinia marincola TaxID=578463 RepID=A0ABN1MDJ4_9FLAO